MNVASHYLLGGVKVTAVQVLMSLFAGLPGWACYFSTAGNEKWSNSKTKLLKETVTFIAPHCSAHTPTDEINMGQIALLLPSPVFHRDLMQIPTTCHGR